MRATAVFRESADGEACGMIREPETGMDVNSLVTDSQSVRVERRKNPLRVCVKQSLEIYFDALNGHEPQDLYELVLCEVERPLLEVVMQQSRGNITRAAEILGINRGTLRKKLKKYALD